MPVNLALPERLLLLEFGCRSDVIERVFDIVRNVLSIQIFPPFFDLKILKIWKTAVEHNIEL